MPSLTPASVSIIIPNFNGATLLKRYLPAVVKASMGAEIVVVDDCSTDESVDFLKTNYPEIKLVIHDKNRRYAAACNSGVAVAKGEIVVLLNSDVAPTDQFLNPLLTCFESRNMFAVGCAEMNDGVVSGRAGGAYRRGLLVHWRCKDQTKRSTLWVSGGSGAFRKSMWQQLGGMDTLFAPAYEEDRDLCYRAMKRGFKIEFCPLSIVYHNHETTNKIELGVDVMQVASFKNHLLLVWKNITTPTLFAQHLFWLPYHLFFTSLRSGGYFMRGFIQALKQLPEVLQKRQLEFRESVVDDETVLASFQE